jgi:hypothetical protein
MDKLIYNHYIIKILNNRLNDRVFEQITFLTPSIIYYQVNNQITHKIYEPVCKGIRILVMNQVYKEN